LNEKTDKAFRLLQMHDRLGKGEFIFKDRAISEFGIPPKTFQRDIDSLREYFTHKSDGELVYDRKQKSFVIFRRKANGKCNER
jgi:predicted DNA-binding transcriptional regulator YafY